MILKRTFYRLHVPTGNRSEATTPEAFGDLNWYAELNKWNAQQPGRWQYWQDATQRQKDVTEQVT